MTVLQRDIMKHILKGKVEKEGGTALAATIDGAL